MSRISQDLASQVAIKLTEKSKNAVTELEKEFRSSVKEAYVGQIPTEVMEVYKKFPQWIQTRSIVEFSGHGFRWEQVIVDGPVVCNTYQGCKLELNDRIAHKLTKAKDAWARAKEGYEKLKDETVQALLALRTFKQITDHIPAAAPFLPPPISNALVVNFDALNKKLDKQPKSIQGKSVPASVK